MLVLEGVSVLALLGLAAAILLYAPLSTSPFKPMPGRGWSGIGYGLVFAVLSLAGFEGAATLGEETHEARKIIPLAMMSTLTVCGAFYTLIAYVEGIGYGPNGTGALVHAASPLGVLASRFLFPGYGIFINVAATIGAFTGVSATLASASRMLFSLGRIGLVPALGEVGQANGVPTRAIVTTGALLGVGLLASSRTASPTHAAGIFFTVGTLALILVYLSVTAGDLRVALRGRRRAEATVGLAGALLLVWPLVNSVYPVPRWPDNCWPYVVLAWFLVGLLLLLSRPSLGRRSMY